MKIVYDIVCRKVSSIITSIIDKTVNIFPQFIFNINLLEYAYVISLVPDILWIFLEARMLHDICIRK